MNTINWQMHCVGDDNPFLEREEEGEPAVAVIHFELDYTYRAVHPGLRTFRTGDPGYPPDPPEIFWTPRCILLEMKSGLNRKPTISEAEIASKWFESIAHGNLGDSIYEACCEAAE